MQETLISLARETVFFFNEIAIYLVFGFGVAGLLHVLFPEKFIIRHMGGNDLRSVLKATFAGIPLPLCSCGVVPVVASLRKKGASKGASQSFLVATPQIGVDSFLVTYSLLGWVFALFRIVAAFATALSAGLASNWLDDKEPFSGEQDAVIADPSTAGERLRGFFRYVQVELLGAFANYLVAGIVLAAAITVLVPASFFTEYMSSPFLSMLLMLAVGIPMYVCATASTPIAASLVLKGMSPGAALVFLLAGPATNAITISTVAKTMGRRAVAIYLGSIAGVSLLLGWLLNLVAAQGMFDLAQHLHLHHEMLPGWLTWAGSITLLAMLALHYLRPFFVSTDKTPQTLAIMSKIATLDVQGMNCTHCSASVKKAVESVVGTKNVNVDLKEGKVVFEHEGVDLEAIKAAIEDKGFEVSR